MGKRTTAIRKGFEYQDLFCAIEILELIERGDLAQSSSSSQTNCILSMTCSYFRRKQNRLAAKSSSTLFVRTSTLLIR